MHTITGVFQIKGPGKPVAAHLHCHAPTCLSMTVYNNKTGAVICEEVGDLLLLPISRLSPPPPAACMSLA